jgi:hypothetical protein
MSNGSKRETDREAAIWEYLKAGQLAGYWDLQVGYSPEE